MGRPKKSAAKHVEPEDEVQVSPEEEPAAIIEPTPTISKAEAVRAAMSAGKDLPGDIREFVLTKFGHDIPNQMISSYKAQEKARQAKKEAAAAPAPKTKPGRKPKAAAPAAAQSPTVPKPTAAANGHIDLLDALTAMKPLIAQYGADQVKKMVDLLG